MHSLTLYRFTQGALCAVTLAGALIWLFVRPSEGTSAVRMFQDVERAGQAQQVATQMMHTVGELAQIDANTPEQERLDVLAEIDHTIKSADRLTRELAAVPTDWIPLDDVEKLVVETRQLGIDARQASQMLHGQGSGGPMPSEPSDTEMAAPVPEDRVALTEGIEAGIEGLLVSSEVVRSSVEQAVARSTFNRGKLLGFEAPDLLFAAILFSAALAFVALHLACRRMTMPPDEVERIELELIHQVDPRAALKRCHDRVKDLLTLAEDFCRPNTAA